MKLINRSTTKKPIKWSSAKNDQKTYETVKRIDELVKAKGTSAFDFINKELSLPIIKSFKVQKSAIMKSETLISDDLKKSILDSANNIKLVCEKDISSLIHSTIKVCNIHAHGLFTHSTLKGISGKLIMLGIRNTRCQYPKHSARVNFTMRIWF